MSQEQELKKGSTSVLILAVLSDGPRHGYAIARESQP
jgi:DNA-binding PadR family transcriptional regulator